MTPSPTTPLRIPDYELLKAIGRGSYGDVWLARSVTGVFRIIKVVRRDRFEDDRPYRRELEGISRFQAAASGRPRQLALLHVGRNDEAGYFYYVMEPADDAETGSAIDPERYIPLTLKELFSRRGRLPAAECVQLALELARGLALLHAANLIHRDIKPANIIFVQRVPKLADVGLVASSDTAMTYVGTEGFSPPEGPGTASGDLYGLGKVLYEIATGLDRLQFPRLPGDIADSPDALLLREINALVLRTCDPDPSQRPASAEAFARDLELIQAGQSVAFYEALRRRLRLVAATAGLVALVAASGAGLFFWRSSILTAANLKTRLALYKSDLAVAQLAHTSGERGRARAALDRQVPRSTEIDLRGIEYSLLAFAVQGSGTPLEPSTNAVAVRNLVADISGKWLAAGFGNDSAAIWDLESGHLVRRLNDVRVVAGFTADGLLVLDEPGRALRFESPLNGLTRRIDTKRRLLQFNTTTDQALLITPQGNLILQLLDPTSEALRWQYDFSTNWPGHNLSSSAISESGRNLAFMFYSETGTARSRTIASVSPESGTLLWSISTSNRVIWLRYSPSGEQICANLGGSVPITLDSRTGTKLRDLAGHSARIQDASYSPDGLYIATASADQNVKIWKSNSGECIATFAGLDRPVTSVTWVGGTNHVAAGSDMGDVRVFSLTNPPPREVITGLHADLHGDLAFSTDSQLLAVSESTNSIAIIDARSLARIATITNAFQPVVFSKDGKFLTALQSDLSLIRISLQENKRQRLSDGPTPRFTLASWALSPDSKTLALTSRDGRITQLDLVSGLQSAMKEPDGKEAWGVTYSPDSKCLWTGNVKGAIRRWDVASGRLLGDVAHVDGEIQTMAISHTGKWAAIGIYGDSTIRILDCEQMSWKSHLTGHRRFVTALLFTKSDNRLISAGSDGRMVVWRVPEFEEIASFELQSATNPTGDEGISTIKIAEDEGGIAALSEDGRLQMWRAH